MLSNWRLVYKNTADVATVVPFQNELAPTRLLDAVVHHDNSRSLDVSEWTLYLILDADLAHPRPATPAFSQEILDTALELYQNGDNNDLCKPKAQLYNLILQAYTQQHQSQSQQQPNTAATAAVREVLDSMEEHEVPPNGRTYKSALRLWSQAAGPTCLDAGAQAEALLQRLYADYLNGATGCQPDVYAFALAVAAWAKTGLPEAGQRCEQIYRQMLLLREQDHLFGQDDISVINNVLLAYSNSSSSSSKQTDALLHQSETFWRSTGVPGNSITYSILIKQYAHLGRVRDVDRLLQESRALATELSTYVLVFKAYAESGGPVERAHELLRQLESDPEIQLNTIVYNGACVCDWKTRFVVVVFDTRGKL